MFPGLFKERFLVLLHVSTTGDEHQVCVSKEAAEVIELAWSVLDATDLAEVSKGSTLVRPISTPVTDLCTSTTTLVWADVEHADTFQQAITTLDKFIQERILSQHASFSFVSMGSWNLKVQIAREARDKGVVLPDYIRYPRLYDLAAEYTQWLSVQTDANTLTPPSLASICASLEIQPSSNDYSSQQGKDQSLLQNSSPRRAAEQCTVLRQILTALIDRSNSTDQRSVMFHRPLDAKADIASFYQESSKVLHLQGLANDTTQSELESWFTSYGGRPVAFWTLRTPDLHKPTGTGFAVFATHEEAAESLNMNGRALGDRTIEVSPSSPRVLDRAAEILTPFPPSKNRPRPGDWTCPSCGFSNFQRRTACFRCSYPSGGALDPIPYYQAPVNAGIGALPGFQPLHNSHAVSTNSAIRGNGGGNVPFRAGDWTCQNCTYHNFARNSVCLKCCSVPRAPPSQDMTMLRYDDYNYSLGAITDDLSRL